MNLKQHNSKLIDENYSLKRENKDLYCRLGLLQDAVNDFLQFEDIENKRYLIQTYDKLKETKDYFLSNPYKF